MMIINGSSQFNNVGNMKDKIVGLFLVVILIILIAIPSSKTEAQINRVPENNLLKNSDFESGTILPEYWYPDAWISGSEYIWDDTQAHLNSRSLKLSSPISNDVRWIQGVSVQPFTDYQLSGWIKTLDVAHSSPIDAGANICIYGTWEKTTGLFGTNDWTYVSMTFNSGDNTRIVIGARLGFWSGTTTGTAWFDEIKLKPVNSLPSPDYKIFIPLIETPACTSTNPSWNILVLVYETTDFNFIDDFNQSHHFVANMTPMDKQKAEYAASRFVNVDIPILTSCNMIPTLTIRYPDHPLTELSEEPCNDYAPDPWDISIDKDTNFDSIITIWDGSGIDTMTSENMEIQGCSYSWPMGTGQTYVAIAVDRVNYLEQNVFKHEWGHSILFYYDAAGTAPDPAVDNHINNTTNRYVNCITGQSYILEDENELNLISNSIYNNNIGFTHDYYSGMTAEFDAPTKGIGIAPSAWASGGPVSKP